MPTANRTAILIESAEILPLDLIMILSRLFRQLPQVPTEPRVPEGQRIYAVGDVHGRADLVNYLRNLIAADLEANPIEKVQTVFLGDYVDRGMDTKAVLELLSTQPFPTPVIPLCGNHEAMLLGFVSDHKLGQFWIQNGGLETLHSYGVDIGEVRGGHGFDAAAVQFRALLPAVHLNFLQSLHLSFTAGDYFFCHAGIRPGIPLSQQGTEDLLWIREEFLKSTRRYEKVVVHGHTPVQHPEIAHNRINLDTGAYISGRLTCLALEGATKRFLVADAAGARAASA
jgi:serine/threonine protein phosphatase 1